MSPNPVWGYKTTRRWKVNECKEHRYQVEGEITGVACPYCEIDRLNKEINRLRQYEDAVTSAVDGTLLVWNLMSTNHTVIKNDYWQNHLEEIDRLKEELEQTRVQLAGCGVAAMCNTRESMTKQMCKPTDYGYSASYEDQGLWIPDKAEQAHREGWEQCQREAMKAVKPEVYPNNKYIVSTIFQCADAIAAMEYGGKANVISR